MELTATQQAAMAKADAEVEQERDWIAARSVEAKREHEALVQHLAAQLRDAREAANLSLSEFSERTGMTRQAISRIEAGENRNPTISTIVRLAEAFQPQTRAPRPNPVVDTY